MMVAGDHSTPALLACSQLAPGAVPDLHSQDAVGADKVTSSTKWPAASGALGIFPAKDVMLAGDGERRAA